MTVISTTSVLVAALLGCSLAHRPQVLGTHRYNIRSDLLRKPMTEPTVPANHSFLNTLICWNFIPNEVKNLPSVNSFTKEQHLETSWNYSNIVFRIPKNYGVNVPIFSIQVLRFQKFLHLVNETESLCGQNKTTRRILEKRDTQQESRKEKKRRRLESKNRVNVMPSLERTERGNGRNRDAERLGGGKLKFKGENGPLEYKGSGGGSFRPRSRKKHHPFHDGELFELSGRNRNLFAVSFDRETGMASLYFKKTLKDSDYMTITHQGSYVEVEVNGRTFADTKGHECAKNYRHLYNVKLIIIESFNCKSVQESMCLLPESRIRLQQWENEPEGPLLVLPSLEALCPNVERKITISMNDIDDGVDPELEYISSITTTMPLDREFRDDSLGFTISCSIEGDSEIANKKNMEALLVIKDVDDSPPIRIKSQKVVWKISQDVEALDDLMMVVDPDIEARNDYDIELRGNHLGLIHVDTSQHHFPSVNKGYCATLTKNFSRPLSAECTVLTPHITFNNQYVHQYPEEEVNFSLVFIDRSLESSHQSNEVQYDLTLTLDHLKGSIIYPVDSMLPPMYEMEFAPETNISLPRPLRKFTRITQMLHPTSHTEYDRLEKGNHTFSLAPQFQKFGVELTPTLGILYISHPDELTYELEKGQVEIIINRGSNSSSVFIEFSENYNSCKNKPTNPPLIRTNGSSCGRHKYKNVCEESCSFGSLAVRCSWRENNGTWITPHFATCTPDLFTCPDGICDELEQIVYEICPQDCVEENNIKQSQNLELNPKRRGYPKRGISKGLGTCSCDDYCQCFPEVSEPVRVPYLKKGTILNKGLEGESCGAACQVGLSLGILLAIFLIVIMFCRKRKDCSGKYKGGEMGRSPFPSDYAEDHSSSYGPPHGEAHAVALHSVHNFHHNSPRPNFNNNNNIQDLLADFPLENVSIDRKWEFPRNQLIIEQTLGEGEFGKVTKARANGIGGQPGYITVAVKMLKSNSTAAELSDLLSEYDLLKEVSHPNVVRLLGACTTKGGPIYLIIEYCRYGSLRSYLRRSRHFELESRVGSVEESPGDYQVTPKELLSFAWQICKGMDYLGNMKLVHRDLAARNVLLAEGKTCKISDFGLTRDVYEGDLYFKRSKSRVPVKWMAIESLVDHVYTCKSDIWGFGVLLWELVNLGSSPYPGVTPERLFTLLQSGYRMEKPENCSAELYQVMRSCWHENPNRRPTFSELTQTFERMIEANVEYLELRSLIVTNREYFDETADVSDCQTNFLPSVQVKESSPASIAKQSTHSNEDFDVVETTMDKDSYLVARSTLTVNPPECQTSLEPFSPTVTPQSTHMSFHGTHMHAHNPAYSPSSDDLPPILQPIQPPLLQYSSLANGPDEEEDVGAVIEEGQDSCRSEADSDSGRATGDSGYITEEGRKSVASKNVSGHPQSFGKPLSSSRGSRGSYSPLTPLEMEGEQEETFEDFEERQELLPEEMLNTVTILTPSPSINSRISPPTISEKGSITSPTAISSSPFTASEPSADGLFSNPSHPQLQQRNRRNPVQV